MVLGTHGARCLVAGSGALEVSQSNGQADVSKAVYTCDTEAQVCVRTFPY